MPHIDISNAAAEGMPSDFLERFKYENAFRNATNIIALAVDLLIENYRRVDHTCVMPVSAADQIISVLALARDASEAQFAEDGQ